MSDWIDELLVAIELHSPERIRAAAAAGRSLADPIRGKPAVDWLLEMYTRSDRFTECLSTLVGLGAEVAAPEALPVLLNDVQAIRARASADAEWLGRRIFWRSAFTPLEGATLLHVAAEYGHLAAARTLLELGVDVNSRAATDADGLNGHTPLFHTVNSNGNRSAPVMHLLLGAGARADLQVSGITWGRGFEWETTCFDVTPVGYAQLGLLPQMHRKEQDIYENVRALLVACGRSASAIRNVPNRYLSPTAS
ncbi:MAG: ankyrin repeat domain-containing protein [Planctomycetes bacterium]|nr:ankyrin repeat domain-containing protein [Planctomycetota bacterium]